MTLNVVSLEQLLSDKLRLRLKLKVKVCCPPVCVQPMALLWLRAQNPYQQTKQTARNQSKLLATT